MTPALELLARELFTRALRDSRDSQGNGGLLPSEAAQLVAGIMGVSPLMVLLAVGSARFNPKEPSA